MCFLIPGPLAAQDRDAPAGTKVYRVDSVRVALEKSNPPNLIVEATGKVRSSGWTNPRLVMRGTGPREGVYEFDFVATPPSGISRPVILPTSAAQVVEKVGNDVKGVRVYAQTNERLQSLDGSKPGSASEETTDPQKRKPCIGSYRAQQLADKTVVVIANGMHNTGGYKVSLEPKQGAALEFELWHEVPEGIVTDAFTPFTTWAWSKADNDVKSVWVHDEKGKHNVKVEFVPDARPH